MEGEIKNFIVVWISAVISLGYCHVIGKIFPSGKARFFSILPVICLFLFLPLNLFTLCLGGPTSFFLSWLATFKLFLFAFGQGPLSTTSTSPQPLSLPSFISLTCLPIKIQQNPQPDLENKPYLSQQINKRPHKSPLNFAAKILILATFVPIYDQKEHIDSKIVMLFYSIYLYIGLEFALAMVASVARAYLSVEFEPQFNEPYLATSLQDFWGRRWNLMVTSILRPTVFNPVKSISTRLIGKEWAPLPAILAVFLVSGVMHELIFYYLGRNKPTWELTCFFLIHGLCVTVEVAFKKAVNRKWFLPKVVSGPLAMAFVAVTALWLFMPQLLLCKADEKALREITALIRFVKGFAQNLGYGLFSSISGWKCSFKII